MKYCHCLASTLVPTWLIATPILVGLARDSEISAYFGTTVFIVFTLASAFTGFLMWKILGPSISQGSITHRTAVAGGCLCGAAHYGVLSLIVGVIAAWDEGSLSNQLEIATGAAIMMFFGLSMITLLSLPGVFIASCGIVTSKAWKANRR